MKRSDIQMAAQYERDLTHVETVLRNLDASDERGDDPVRIFVERSGYGSATQEVTIGAEDLRRLLNQRSILLCARLVGLGAEEV